MRPPPSLLVPLLALMACQGAPRASSHQEASHAPVWGTPKADARPKVLLVGWDGVRPDVLREVPTPNLDALTSAGTFSEEARNVQPTVSGPCWSSMLTGTRPEKHGVRSNDFSSNRYGGYPDFLTRIESVRPELNTFAAADWLPLVAQDAGGPLVSEEVDRKVVLNGYDLGWPEADSLAVEAAVDELRAGDPDALFVYVGAPDEISHEIGGIGEDYRQSIATADAELGRLLDAIRARPTLSSEDWLVLVATDHGRTASGGHGGDSPEETTVFYLASGPSAREGRPAEPPSIMDVAVTALTHLGIAVDPGWHLDGRVVGLEGGIPVLPRSRTDTIRVLAYNTHHGEGADGVLDLERIGSVIGEADPDVVALQEIDVGVERTGRIDQAERYGGLTRMEPLFGDFMDYQGGRYGMALLSRLPVVEWTNHRLPPGEEPRSSVAARLRMNGSGRELVVAGIHFYRTEEERLAQARRLMGVLDEEEAPVLLVGDFNSTPQSAVMDLLEEQWAVPTKTGGTFTFPADAPAREIDFILVRAPRGFRVLEYEVLDESVASDHRPVFMVLELR